MAHKMSKRHVRECVVCDDEVVGFHYGAWVCSPCLNFFSRFMKAVEYFGSCRMEEHCDISVQNRDACKYCRLKKCISVGMSSPDVVSDQSALNWVYLDTMEYDLIENLVQAIEQAHKETCTFTEDEIANIVQGAKTHSQYVQKIHCPVNKNPSPIFEVLRMDDILDEYQGFKDVIDFAIKIPDFSKLQKDDQITLVKAGLFPVAFIRFVSLFDSRKHTLFCLNGLIISFGSMKHKDAKLLSNMSHIAREIKSLKLTDKEIAVLSSVVMINIRNLKFKNSYLVFKLEIQLRNVLRKLVTENHPDNPDIMKTLNNIIFVLDIIHEAHYKRISNRRYNLKAS